MNYRHAFHAGNHGDVLKHALLSRVLVYLAQKEAPLAVLDAHAGVGHYDLTSLEALKTSEWRGGIGKLMASPMKTEAAALLQPYLDIVRALNSAGVLQYYPGSPEISRRLLRKSDRLMLNELHPLDHETLASRYRIYKNVRLTSVDALQVVKAAMPFPEKRGLVLLDPAFEVVDEFKRVSNMVAQALQRMAHVCMMIWYPVTTQEFADDLCAGLRFDGARSVLRAELVVRKPEANGGLAGSGVVVVNPPWPLFDEVNIILPALSARLGESGKGQHVIKWLVPPS